MPTETASSQVTSFASGDPADNITLGGSTRVEPIQIESSEWVKMLAKTNETEPYNNISPYRPHLEPAFAFPIMLSVDISLFETKGNFSRECRQLARDAIKSVIFFLFFGEMRRCVDMV